MAISARFHNVNRKMFYENLIVTTYFQLLEISRKLYARKPFLGCGTVRFNGKVVLSLSKFCSHAAKSSQGPAIKRENVAVRCLCRSLSRSRIFYLITFKLGSFQLLASMSTYLIMLIQFYLSLIYKKIKCFHPADGFLECFPFIITILRQIEVYSDLIATNKNKY